jgi:Rad3-related DNA helicase
MAKFLPNNLQTGGKTLRPKQVELFEKIDNAPKGVKVFGLQCPTGQGKTLISFRIQEVTRAPIICSKNLLIDQLVDEYPEIIPIYAQTDYQCPPWMDHNEKLGIKYAAKYARTRLGDPTAKFAFTIVSYSQNIKKIGKGYSSDIVVDEAHTLPRMTRLLTNQDIKTPDKIRLPSGLNEFSVIAWLELVIKCTYDYERKAKAQILLDVLKTKPETITYAYNDNKNGLVFNTVDPPLWLLQKLFPAGQKFLLSGTLLKPLIPLIVPGVNADNIEFIDVLSDFPVNNRRINYIGVPFRENGLDKAWGTKVVPVIAELVTKYKISRTLVHSTYSVSAEMAKSLQEALPNISVLTYTKELKAQTIEEWKQSGGILVGAGLHEGSDFKDGLLRLNIIPKLPFADFGSPAVLKAFHVPGGQTLYQLDALVKLIQALGRGVRSADDYCINIVLDPAFPKLYLNTKAYLPAYFTEALNWESKLIIPEPLKVLSEQSDK